MNLTLRKALALAFATGLASAAQAAPSLGSGIDTSAADPQVRVQDDFFRAVNGSWLKSTEIPGDKSRWGAFDELRLKSEQQVKTLVEKAVANGASADANTRKIIDLYASYMDEARLNQLGTQPIVPELTRVDGLASKSQLMGLVAHFNRIGAAAPVDVEVTQDAKDSSIYVVEVKQSGLGMPDREYYLGEDARMKDFRAKYLAHVEKMLTLAKQADAGKKAADIVAFETEMAKIQWSRVDMRDPVKGYNKVMFADLAKQFPGYDWDAYLKGLSIADKTNYLVIKQPTYLSKLAELIEKTPIETVRTYFQWKVVSSYARFLGSEMEDEQFAFHGATLSGLKEKEPRWQRAVSLENAILGEALGKMYVDAYFPPASKERMEQLVGNLLKAYKISIDKIDWMSPATKKEAQAKLAAFRYKIGYPSKWRDYSGLEVSKDDLVGNLMRAEEFEFQRNINKLGKPIDREEWGMTPQTVNAYYSPEMNEIVFPAAILQPPFFNAEADDAVNYGAIGAVIGHEISHGFDDEGSQYDGKGNLRDWWTAADHKKFGAKTAALVKQYDAYSPVANYHVNGKLTLGENIADNSGLAIAYKAYKLSLGGKPSTVIDGMTGEQRFYRGFGQVWKGKIRDQEAIKRVTTDPHSPGEFRANGTVVNQPGYYEAFGVKKGDKMYVDPKNRVIIW